MKNKICTALANAAQFRVDQGQLSRAEELYKKCVDAAEFGGYYGDVFFARANYAHFLIDQHRDDEAERELKAALDAVPLRRFNLRHSLALKELGQLFVRTGRKEEGEALQDLAFEIFMVLSDDVCHESVRTYSDRAS